MKNLYLGLIFTFLISQISIQAQLTVDSSQPINTVIQNLLGPNVQFSNVTFSGNADQIGLFNSTTSNLPFPTGVIMGTGGISNAIGPNTSGSSSITGGNFGATDADLDLLDGLTHNDAAILEFDFISTGTSISFDYVFASEEYPEFTGAGGNCGNVSDVFGFFLSGPGIVGTFSNASENIALIPGTTQFVSINNLNAGCDGLAIPGGADCNYCEYYVYNGTGTDMPYSGSANYIQYDGMTVVLTAVYENLECGQTYHIKLAIADVSDTAWDSAVFLKEGSFNVGGSLIESVAVTNPGVSPIPGFPANSILEGEGCYNGQFVITPPPCMIENDTIQLIYSGTATIGEDYNTNGLTEIILFPGISDTLFVNGMIDNVVEGTQTVTFGNVTAGYETIEIGFIFFNPTTQVMDTATAFLNIIDYVPTELAPVTDILNLCPSATVPVNAVPLISNGVPNYTFNWQDGAGATIGTNAVQSFAVGSAGNYELTVTDYCGNADSSLFIITEPPAIAFAGPQDLCTGTMSEVLVSGGLGFGPNLDYYQFVPSDSQAFNIGSLNYVAAGLIGGEFYITITDSCNQVGVVPFVFTVCDTEAINIFTPSGDGINEGFIIKGIESFPNSELQVYNRWGTLVFESPNYSNENPWDGKNVEDGVYYWILKRSDGVNPSPSGYVHVIHD
jgi:gliding motility-associated-like protein